MCYQRFVFLLVLCAIHPWESGCIIEDLQDIIDVTYHFGEYLLGCCVHQSQSEPTTHNQIELPWLRDKQKKVMSQIKVLSQDIDHMEDKHSHFMIAFTAATMNSVISNSQAVMLLIRLERIRHRIDSMYRHMKILERNMEKVDVSTLVHMANWFVNPNSDSVVHVLTLLHLELMGRSDDHGFRWDRSGLNLLVKY